MRTWESQRARGAAPATCLAQPQGHPSPGSAYAVPGLLLETAPAGPAAALPLPSLGLLAGGCRKPSSGASFIVLPKTVLAFSASAGHLLRGLPGCWG